MGFEDRGLATRRTRTSSSTTESMPPDTATTTPLAPSSKRWSFTNRSIFRKTVSAERRIDFTLRCPHYLLGAAQTKFMLLPDVLPMPRLVKVRPKTEATRVLHKPAIDRTSSLNRSVFILGVN